MAIYADDIKNILYILPVLSGERAGRMDALARRETSFGARTLMLARSLPFLRPPPTRVSPAIICMLFVRFLNKSSAEQASTRSDWTGVQLNSGGGGGGGGGLSSGVLSIMNQADAELENVKNIGIVLDYNDAALEAHARKGKISQSDQPTANSSSQTSEMRVVGRT